MPPQHLPLLNFMFFPDWRSFEDTVQGGYTEATDAQLSEPESFQSGKGDNSRDALALSDPDEASTQEVQKRKRKKRRARTSGRPSRLSFLKIALKGRRWNPAPADSLPVLENLRWRKLPFTEADGVCCPVRFTLDGHVFTPSHQDAFRGSYGSVWRFTAGSDGVPDLAVKCVLQRRQRSPTVDAKNEARLHHHAYNASPKNICPILAANVVRIQGALEHEMVVIAMMWMDSGDLRSYVKGDVSLGALRCVLCTIGTTLAELHSQNIVHGDVKVSNVLVDRVEGARCPKVMLADFGLTGTSKAPVHVGSTSYMGPETVAYVHSSDHYCDHSFHKVLQLCQTLLPRLHATELAWSQPALGATYDAQLHQHAFSMLASRAAQIYMARDCYSFGILIACVMCRNSGSTSFLLQLQGLPPDTTRDAENKAKLRGHRLDRKILMDVLQRHQLSLNVCHETADVVLSLTNPDIEQRWTVQQALANSRFFNA